MIQFISWIVTLSWRNGLNRVISMIPLRVNLQSCLPTCTRSETAISQEVYCPVAGAQGKEFKSSEEEPYYRARGSRNHAMSSTDCVVENEMKRVLQKETAEDNSAQVPAAHVQAKQSCSRYAWVGSGVQIPRIKRTKKQRKEESLPQTARLWVQINSLDPSAPCRFADHQRIPLGFPGGSVVKNPPVDGWDACLIPESGRSPGEGNGNPLQYFCLENPMDRGACQTIVHRVTKSQTQLSWLNSKDTSTSWNTSSFPQSFVSILQNHILSFSFAELFQPHPALMSLCILEFTSLCNTSFYKVTKAFMRFMSCLSLVSTSLEIHW